MLKMITIEDVVIETTQTTEESKQIHAIGRDTVHKICSGQVILNLATAVKELVENSIDAGATIVEVKLKEQGCEMIEVSDNGCGVEEKNFEGLTAKYHTSKIKEFTDLENIETFGFRGEALSSLCDLSDMVIVTRHHKAPHGTKIELDHRGVIKNKSPIARAIGTTVSLGNLFSTLPVRKKEFQKNSKREFVKMCQVLQAYCLVTEGVRIICSNISKSGSRSTVLCTPGINSVLDNVTAIFGAKQTAELVPLKPAILQSGRQDTSLIHDDDEPLELSQEEVDKLNLARFQIDGFISSCQHGSGRSSRDRQFFYVNSRPCEPKAIIKLVNEMYHRYNVNQSPFVFLNLKMKRSDVDVNLTPDKRQVLVNNEKILLLALKKSLLNTFGDIPSTFKMQNLSINKSFPVKNKTPKKEMENEEPEEDEFALTQPNKTKFSQMLFQWRATGLIDKTSPGKGTKRKNTNKTGVRILKMKKIEDYMSQSDPPQEMEFKAVSYKSESDTETDTESENIKIEYNTPPDSDNDGFKIEILSQENGLGCKIEILTPPEQQENGLNEQELYLNEDDDFEFKIECKNKEIKRNDSIKLVTEPIPSTSTELKIETLDIESYVPKKNSRNFILKTDISVIKSQMEKEIEAKKNSRMESKTNLERLKFKTQIDPSNNKAAEEELQTEISKEMFSKMKIIGQFNLGFIIVKLDDDLFIIDQHATDEKYNFEDLQKTTVLQSQQLVLPQNLEMTAVNELILMDNLEIFEMNGFKFEIDGAADATKKIKLLAKPFSKNWEFGKEDIDELVFMLQDAPNTICRPSRVRSMFASRACRKSVMIGTALSTKEMRKLVDHMGEIEQPWNCPHGRPTMRHLINLKMIAEDDEKVEAENECFE